VNRPTDVPTQHLFDLDFVSAPSVDGLVEVLLDQSGCDDRWRCVVTPNVDHLVRYQHNQLEADVARRAMMVLPDGMPIVWASRLLGRPLAARLTGADLFAGLWSRLANEGAPVVLIVANHEVAGALAAMHPQARCIVPPMFDVGDEVTIERLLADAETACAETDARFLVVGVSMPKHHLIADRLRRRWSPDYAGRPMVLLLGQSPEFAIGHVRRAPAWMQRSGLEWVWRLAGDPARLAKRYLVDDAQFVRVVYREWRRRYRVPLRRTEKESE
jgi:N-acetylglucosaminyldiphosphoundecaprenol N-acetyl-beta-D-mannosaminyltransferase